MNIEGNYDINSIHELIGMSLLKKNIDGQEKMLDDILNLLPEQGIGKNIDIMA
jgi:hypothetical protein